MINQEPSDEITHSNQEAARQMVDRYGWELASPDDLIESALALIANGEAKIFTKALVGAYCVIMYWAFVGEQGAERQRRACDELGRTLAGILKKNYSYLPTDEREDVSQDTLARVWRARESCREPIAFLAFATSHLRTAVQLARRQLGQGGGSWAPTSDPNDLDIPDQAPSLFEQVLSKERLSDIRHFIAELRRVRKRAKDQIDILELRYLEDLDYVEISARLKIPQHIAQNKLSKIIKTIRDDPELSRRARELGIEGLD